MSRRHEWQFNHDPDKIGAGGQAIAGTESVYLRNCYRGIVSWWGTNPP